MGNRAVDVRSWLANMILFGIITDTSSISRPGFRPSPPKPPGQPDALGSRIADYFPGYPGSSAPRLIGHIFLHLLCGDPIESERLVFLSDCGWIGIWHADLFCAALGDYVLC